MQNPNPSIPLTATFAGCQVIIRGLRKLPIEEAADLLNELVGQVNAFIKTVEDAEKADAEKSTKAVDAVVKTLKRGGRPKGVKNKPKAEPIPVPVPPLDAASPVL